MRRISGTSLLTLVVLAALLAFLPGALLRIAKNGDLYLFTEQFFHDLMARLSGPGKLRFVIQPLVAIALGVQGGNKDAAAGKPPFLSAIFFSREHRKELLRNALSSVRNLLAIGIVLDLLSQFFLFAEVRPGAALVVGPVLIGVPYALSRALSNRISTWNRSRRLLVHKSP